MTKDEITQYVWNYLNGLSLPHKSISAVMGNIEWESSFDPSLVESGSGIGFGLCQWSFERRTQLERYGTTLDKQCNFLADELLKTNFTGGIASFQWINKNGYLSYDDFMTANGSIDDLTSAMCFCWERPAYATSHIDKRIQSANDYYNKYHNTTTEPKPPEPPEPEQTQEVYKAIVNSGYNMNKLNDDIIAWLKTLTFNQDIEITPHFNKDKKLCYGYTGGSIKINGEVYKLESVNNKGFLVLSNGTICKRYVDPRYITDLSVNFTLTSNGKLNAVSNNSWSGSGNLGTTDNYELFVEFS